MCPLADIYKQMGEKMIASKSRLREEWEKLGGITLISPPCFKPPETPMTRHLVLLYLLSRPTLQFTPF